MDRTHSIMRIATTASPVSGADVRERMEELWGDPSAGLWTPLLLCPACIALLESELAECIAALEKIANPISAMKRALPVGATLNGAMATTLSNDPNYLKEIAKAALAARKGEGSDG